MAAAAASRMGPLADALEERGHEVRVLSSKQASSEDPRVQVSRFETPSFRGSLPRRLVQEMRLGRDLGRLLKQLAPKPDLTILTSPPFFMACRCARTLRRLNLPYVLDVRDRYPRVLFDLGLVRPSGITGRYLQRMERNAYDGARLVATVTRGLTEDLGEVAGKGKVAWFPNGFDGKVFAKKASFPSKDRPFTVFYHGRLGRFYDVEALRALIQETERLDSNVRFRLAGDLGAVSRNGDWGRAEFLGEKSLPRIADFLAESNLGICLLKDSEAMQKAFPAKVYEYLGAGLPVLATPVGELTEFLTERDAGIVFPKADPQAMAQAIVELKADPTAWNRMSDNAWALRSSLDRRDGANRFAERLERIHETSVKGKLN